MRLAIGRAAVCALSLSLMAAGARAHAQDDLFLPNVHLFRTPLADPMATRISVGLMSTNLLASQGDERPAFTVPDQEQAARETVAAVSVGAIFPLLKLADWEGGGAALIADFKVFSRFRIQLPSRDDMGQDWFVGGGVDWRDELWSGRVAIMHRSSHIGDEFSLATGAQRIEFGSEQLDVTTSYEVPGIARVYGGGSWIFRSYLAWEPLLEPLDIDDRAVLQFGIDREWTPSRDPRLRIYTGVDWHAAERTSWRGGIAAAAGIGVSTPRSLRLMARFYRGNSTMGEFFRTRERYFALELVGEF
jgi:hypothetical protein